MKRTRIYIDGYNLYYGLLKGSVHKWLDLVKFSQELLAPDHEIVEVNYFTSIITPHPYERESIERQNVYLQALGMNPLVRVEKGRYYKRTAHLPPVSKGCQSCDELRNGYVRVYKFEEKQSDVNLAVRMVRVVSSPTRYRLVRMVMSFADPKPGSDFPPAGDRKQDGFGKPPRGI